MGGVAMDEDSVDYFEVIIPHTHRIRPDRVRLTFGRDIEYHMHRDHLLARLIQMELECLPQDRLLLAIIATLLKHWWDGTKDHLVDKADALVGIMHGAYLNRKKIRENRRGRAMFHWKDGHVQPPEVTILPIEGEDDGDGGDTLGLIAAIPAPAKITPSISLPSLPRAPVQRRRK
jgi:hypothetical protein